jgi:hypothetical protein
MTVRTIALLMVIALVVCLLGHVPVLIMLVVACIGLVIAKILIKRGSRLNLWAVTADRVIRTNSYAISEWIVQKIVLVQMFI